MGLVRTVAPTVEPLTVAELKAHLRVTHAQEDDLLASYLSAAREACEAYTRRAFLNQTYRYTLDDFPSAYTCGVRVAIGERAKRFPDRVIELPRPPLISLTADESHPTLGITYYDEDDALQTLSSSTYTVDTDSIVGCIVLKEDESWPSVSSSIPNAVRITYRAGYGTAATAVPNTLKAAVRFLVGHLYKIREPINIGNIVNEIPMTLKAMLNVERIPQFE